MQNDPEKTAGNYNEFVGASPPASLPGGIFELYEEEKAGELQEDIAAGLRLVHSKVDEILGENNKLTDGSLALPRIRLVATDPEHPTWSGYFSSDRNEIVLIKDKIKDRLARTKVFIHEYLHFLSHNGHDDSEQIAESTPIARNNNIGFRRFFGLDIRKGKEGEKTGDYFLAFNEGVTEQLAMDILPGVHETYDDYRGLLNQVIDDTTAQRLGTESEGGTFQPWSREQVKSYIYGCFFRGDLAGFTRLLKTTYRKYDISEQQFGLMTHRDDLPSVIEYNWAHNNPDSPPPLPDQVAAMVQQRLDNKTPDDYVTDIIGPEPEGENNNRRPSKHGAEYDTYVRENNIVCSHREIIDGKEYDIDSHGYIIYRGEDSSLIFQGIQAELDDLLIKAEHGEVDAKHISERMNQLLFQTYFTSMLSDGFRDFYIYKHSKIDTL